MKEIIEIKSQSDYEDACAYLKTFKNKNTFEDDPKAFAEFTRVNNLVKVYEYKHLQHKREVGEQSTMKVAVFVAFNNITKMPFTNKTTEQIIDEIADICNTGYLIRIDTYEAKFLEEEHFNQEVIK